MEMGFKKLKFKKFQNLFTASIVVSVLLHVTTILSLKYMERNNFSVKQNQTVDVVFIDPSKLAEMQAKQIVEQDEKPVNDEIDSNAQYLSQFNQKVVKETKAANNGKYNNNAGKGLTKGQATKAVKEAMDIQPQKKAQGSVLDKFKPKVDWTAMANKNAGGDGQDISRTADHLKDIEKGAQTVLSTREFVYYSYFKRIKGQIQQQWEPSIKGKMQKLMSRGRTIASVEDRTTKLLIILNAKGTLVGVKVISESGVQDLDDAAIEAFKAAAPFPNPPAGIVEQDGTIQIRWDFVLEA
jgi:TonB family protein